MTYYPEADPLYKTVVVLAVGQASAARYIYQAFNIAGTVQLVGLYATLTGDVSTVELSDLAWDIGKESDVTGGTWLTNGAGPTGADMSGFEAGAWIGKCAAAASVAAVLDASAFGLYETPLDEGSILQVDAGEVSATTIGFQVTEDNDTNAEFTMVCLWKPRSPGASVTAGSGATRSDV